MSADFTDQVRCGPAHDLDWIPTGSLDAVVTSIPFERMRTYSSDSQDLGNCQGQEFVDRLRPVIVEWLRVLRPTGNLLLNFSPQLIDGVLSPTHYLLPQALVSAGFHVVQELSIIKTNAMPENDPRLLKRSVEKVYHAVLDPVGYRVFKDAIRRPSYWAGRDRRPKYSPLGADPGGVIVPALERLRRLSEKDVLTALIGEHGDTLAIAKTQNQTTVHPAKMADEVARWLIAYGSPPGGTVGDNFCGGGTSLVQARGLGRHFGGSDLNEEYVEQARESASRVAFGEYLKLPYSPKSSDTGRPGTRAQRDPGIQVRRCRLCRTEFLPKKSWQDFCSDPCRHEFNNDRRRKHVKAVDD